MVDAPPSAVPTPAPAFVRADPTHTDALVELVSAYHAFDRIPFDAPALRKGLAALFADAALGGAWLIQIDGANVGYFVLSFAFDLEFGGRVATVTDLYLHEHVRGVGLGRATLAFIEEVLRGHAIGAYELQVERANTNARAFYERLGFHAHDRIPLSKKVGARSENERT